jgi:hypothetical protein
MRQANFLVVALFVLTTAASRGADTQAAEPPKPVEAKPQSTIDIDRLTTLARSQKVDVLSRTSAIDVLGKVGPDQAKDVAKKLKQILDDLNTAKDANDKSKRDLLTYHTVNALASIGPAASEALDQFALITTSDPDVKKAMAAAVAAIGTAKPSKTQPTPQQAVSTGGAVDTETSAYVAHLTQILKGQPPPAPLSLWIPLAPPFLWALPAPTQKPDPCDQIKAANALGALGKDASCAITVLKDKSTKADDEGLKAAASAALKKIQKALEK